MSVTKMDYNLESESFQCEMKLTAHDLEHALKILSGKAVILDKPAYQNSNNKMVAQYLQNKFSTRIDDEKVYVDFVGYEVELNDNIWIYFEIKCPTEWENIMVSNLVLTETFALQQNVTHITKDSITQSFVFNKNETNKTFTWK